MSDLKAKFEALSPEQKQAFEETILELVEAARASNQLDKMTDGEVANLVDKWHGEVAITTALSSLLETVVDRLHRADGGPLPEEG